MTVGTELTPINLFLNLHKSPVTQHHGRPTPRPFPQKRTSLASPTRSLTSPLHSRAPRQGPSQMQAGTHTLCLLGCHPRTRTTDNEEVASGLSQTHTQAQRRNSSVWGSAQGRKCAQHTHWTRAPWGSWRHSDDYPPGAPSLEGHKLRNS